MNRVSKVTFAAIACLAITGGSAFADDQPAGGGGAGVDVSGGAAAGGDPNAAPPAGAPAAGVTATGGKGAKTIGADVMAVLPLSDYADAVDFGVGALARFEFGLNDMMSITARAGLLYHIGGPVADAELTFLIVPIMGGIKYKIGTSGLFAAGEAGLAYTRLSGDGGSESETNLGLNLGVGYQMDKLQFRGEVFIPDIGEIDSALGIMVNAGYDFAAL
jgi:hypothetical protein